MIALLDYGVGNRRSLINLFSQFDQEVKITKELKDIHDAELLVLPGVGNFETAVACIDRFSMRNAILKRLEANRPTLGICLGMQLLFEGSQESPQAKGLGFFKGQSKKFPRDFIIPHMGWNNLIDDPLSDYYFVHSYYVTTKEAIEINYCDYGIPFPAYIKKGRIMGMQFHPEKSGENGRRLIASYLEEIKEQENEKVYCD